MRKERNDPISPVGDHESSSDVYNSLCYSFRSSFLLVSFIFGLGGVREGLFCFVVVQNVILRCFVSTETPVKLDTGY